MAHHHQRRPSGKHAIISGLSATALIGGAISASATLSSASAAEWPSPNGEETVTKTIEVKAGEVFDGEGKRFIPKRLGGGEQGKAQQPVFKLAKGATVKNVILGAPGADGVHCSGSCTVANVWWEDIGEDAATFRGKEDSVFMVKGGGARKAGDKVLEHNGGGKLVVAGFAAEDFTTLYRSCGNCSTQYKRSAIFRDIEITAPGSRLAGINQNYGDSVTFRNTTIIGDSGKKTVPCQKYSGNDQGKEPIQEGTDWDGTHCNIRAGDITYK